MKIKTGTIRDLKRLNGLDVTVKSGDKVFAPSWEIVMGYKNGSISAETYTEKYIQMMRLSYKKNRSRWEEVLKMDEICFCCYCAKNEFCHRHILADIFKKICESKNITVEIIPE